MKQNSENVTPMLVEQTMTGSSLLSQNKLQRYVKSKVGNAFQDKVDLFFEFLLSFFFFSNFLLEICNFLHLLLVFYNVMIYMLLSRSVLTVGALMRAILSKSQ